MTTPQCAETIDLEFLLDAHIDLAPAEGLRATPFGAPSIFVVTGGTLRVPAAPRHVRA